MVIAHNLNSRQRQILWATIRRYVATAEPVGSKTLVEEYDFNVSSATVRNAMVSLERAGLLYQPHTSAGRIPSDSGYRLYVDHLMKPEPMAAQQACHLLDQQWQQAVGNLEALLNRAVQVLSRLSGYMALVTVPQTLGGVIRHVQLVPVSSRQVMLILVTDNFQTQSLLIEGIAEEEEPFQDTLQWISNFINHQLQGRSPRSLNQLDWSEWDRQLRQWGERLRSALESFQAQTLNAQTSILMQGISALLNQPEFSQLQQVQTLLHLLEVEQNQLLPLILEPTFPEEDRRATIRIGMENPLEPMRSCALISAQFFQEGIPVGSVGLLGPTRMFYENAIALVETTADYLSETLSSGNS